MIILRLIISTLIWIAVAWFWSKRHAKTISNDQRDPLTAKDLLSRIMAGAFADFFTWFGLPYDPGIFLWLVSISYLYSTWRLSFDFFINHHRGFPLTYSSASNGKWLDRIYAKRFWLKMVIQGSIFVGSLAVIIWQA